MKCDSITHIYVLNLKIQFNFRAQSDFSLKKMHFRTDCHDFHNDPISIMFVFSDKNNSFNKMH